MYEQELRKQVKSHVIQTNLSGHSMFWLVGLFVLGTIVQHLQEEHESDQIRDAIQRLADKCYDQEGYPVISRQEGGYTFTCVPRGEPIPLALNSMEQFNASDTRQSTEGPVIEVWYAHVDKDGTVVYLE